MKLIIAVDNNNGMLFNWQRQSQDRTVREHILALASGSRLWVNNYTAKQFMEDGIAEDRLSVSNDFMEKAAPGEYVFVENVTTSKYKDKIEEIIVFKWNQYYPSDFSFDINLKNGAWHLVSSEEFPGSSHEKITMEVYKR